MARFEPKSLRFLCLYVNNTDSLAIGITFIGDLKWQTRTNLKKCLSA